MELVQLSVKLVAYGPRVVNVELPFVLAPDVPVQPDGQARMVAAHGYGLAHGASCDHEASTGDDATGVTLQDAAVDARGCTEVVGVNNEISLHVSLSPLGGLLRQQLCETNVREQTRGHRAGLGVFLRYCPRRFTVPPVVAVDSIDSRQGLIHGGEGEESFAGGQDVTEARILSNHGLATRQIADISLAEPPATKADVLIFGNCKFGARLTD